jgi:hypothetical protein
VVLAVVAGVKTERLAQVVRVILHLYHHHKEILVVLVALVEFLPLAVAVAVAVRLELLAWPQTHLRGREETVALER